VSEAGNILEPSNFQSSVEVEYEGLLFALKHLKALLQRKAIRAEARMTPIAILCLSFYK
jgi:hypothetical protein